MIKKYKFDTSLEGFYQELDERKEFNRELPYFIAPISSISRTNIEPLKFAILEAINTIKRVDSEENCS